MKPNKKEILKQFEALLIRWQADNITFVKEFLGITLISKQQQKALRAVQLLVNAKLKRWRKEPMTDKEKNLANKIGVSVMAGKGVGKDALTSWLIVWFLMCFYSSKIPMTGPSEDQVKDILLAEISKWLSRLGDDGKPACIMPNMIEVRSNKIYIAGDPKQGKNWFAKIRVARQDASEEQKAKTLDGWHEDFMMVVADEAASVSDAVFKAFDTTLTGPVNFVLMIFNPSRNTGYAYETHYGKRAKHWIKIHMDARHSELVRPEQVRQIRDTYGEDSIEYKVNVCGLPPTDTARGLIPYQNIKSAINREIDTTGEPVVMGVDPARGGKDTFAILVRKGFKVTHLYGHNNLDIPDGADVVANYIIDHEPVRVYIDTIGIGGAIYDLLRRRFPGVCFPVDVARTATLQPKSLGRGDKKRFGRLRDELYWRLRLLFTENMISIPKHPVLVTELQNIKEEDTEDGRLKIESKVKIKKKGGKSPNFADALMLTTMSKIQSLREKKVSDKKVRRKDEDFNLTDDDNSWLYA